MVSDPSVWRILTSYGQGISGYNLASLLTSFYGSVELANGMER